MHKFICLYSTKHKVSTAFASTPGKRFRNNLGGIPYVQTLQAKDSVCNKKCKKE